MATGRMLLQAVPPAEDPQAWPGLPGGRSGTASSAEASENESETTPGKPPLAKPGATMADKIARASSGPAAGKASESSKKKLTPLNGRAKQGAAAADGQADANGTDGKPSGELASHHQCCKPWRRWCASCAHTCERKIELVNTQWTGSIRRGLISLLGSSLGQTQGFASHAAGQESGRVSPPWIPQPARKSAAGHQAAAAVGTDAHSSEVALSQQGALPSLAPAASMAQEEADSSAAGASRPPPGFTAPAVSKPKMVRPGGCPPSLR